jgi:hypothetical protein
MRGLQRGEHEELVEGRKGRSERLGLRSDVNQRCPACLDWTGRERKKEKSTIKKEEERVWIAQHRQRWLPLVAPDSHAISTLLLRLGLFTY